MLNLLFALVAAPLPSPWESIDVGTTRRGSTTFQSGTFVSTAGGRDVEGENDEFRFTFQPLTGDVTLTAHVTSLFAPSEWAKAGLMIREGRGADAKNVFLAVTPAHGTLLQKRPTAGWGTQVRTFETPASSTWLRIRRVGDRVSAFRSEDGKNWILVGDPMIVSMGRTVDVGLAHTAHGDALGTATFAEVEIAKG